MSVIGALSKKVGVDFFLPTVLVITGLLRDGGGGAGISGHEAEPGVQIHFTCLSQITQLCVGGAGSLGVPHDQQFSQ